MCPFFLHDTSLSKFRALSLIASRTLPNPSLSLFFIHFFSSQWSASFLHLFYASILTELLRGKTLSLASVYILLAKSTEKPWLRSTLLPGRPIFLAGLFFVTAYRITISCVVESPVRLSSAHQEPRSSASAFSVFSFSARTTLC